MKKLWKLIGVSLLLLTIGCSSNQTATNTQTELTLSVAASLTDCMEEIQKAFQEQYPHISLQFNFGASGTLQQQIEQGAPVDLFFSAGTKQMNALVEKGLVDKDTVKEMLCNKLVLIKPSTSNEAISFNDLKDEKVKKIAVGEPGSVPVGQYTMEVFDYLDIMSQVENKLVYAKDVREVLSWVETGNVDAGIVYETDAKISEAVTICDTADEKAYSPVIYPVAMINTTAHADEVKLLIDFMETDAVKAIFESYGFTVVAD